MFLFCQCITQLTICTLVLFPLWAIRVSLPGKTQQAEQPQEQRYPLLSVCAVLWCPNTAIWLPVLGVLTYAQMSMMRLQTGAVGTRTVRESALKADWEKRLTNPSQYHAWFSVGLSTSWHIQTHR